MYCDRLVTTYWKLGSNLQNIVFTNMLNYIALMHTSDALALSDTQTICSRQLWKHLVKLNYWIEMKTWQKKNMLNMSNFSFCHNFFKGHLLQLHQNKSVRRKWLTMYRFWTHGARQRNCSKTQVIIFHCVCFSVLKLNFFFFYRFLIYSSDIFLSFSRKYWRQQKNFSMKQRA